MHVTKSYTRSSPETPLWFQTPAGEAWVIYRKETYGSSILSMTSLMSSDGLTTTYVTTWSSIEDRNRMMQDEVILSGINARIAYNAQNGITESESVISNS